jgi:hypothetical protein
LAKKVSFSRLTFYPVGCNLRWFDLTYRSAPFTETECSTLVTREAELRRHFDDCLLGGFVKPKVLWITNPFNFDQERRMSGWKGALAVCFVLCTLGLSVSANAQTQPTFSTFDPPGSVNTYPASINPAGVITGYYYDADLVPHGFLRSHDGTITTFDVPGGIFTVPTSINPAGEIMGHYFAATGGLHGFLRVRDGTFTTFDPAGGGDTVPASINPAGASCAATTAP